MKKRVGRPAGSVKPDNKIKKSFRLSPDTWKKLKKEENMTAVVEEALTEYYKKGK